MKPLTKLNAQLLYVITIAWFVAAVGCFIKGVGSLAVIFAAMGAIHLVWAIARDLKEGKMGEEKKQSETL